MADKINLHLNTLQLKIIPNNKVELRKTYLMLMQIWHPDKHYDEDKKKLATHKAQQLNEAYEYLSEILEDYDNLTTNKDTNTTVRYNNYQTRHTYQNQEYTVGFPKPDIFEIFLKSSFIVSTGYNKFARILYVKIQNNKLYKYYDVPESIFNDFINSDSPGRYANRYIFHNFRYESCI
jgi:DnaJ-class molecular chaperone